MSNEVIPYEQRVGALSVQDVRSQVSLIQHILKEVMQEGQHFGIIPGTGTKPSLLKAGAEKLCLTFRLDPQYESTERYDGVHLTVKSKCTLYHIPSGQRFGSGEGSCSTRESKYAYRNAARKCPHCSAESIIKGKEEYGGGWLCYAKKGGCGAKFKDDDETITKQVVGRMPNEDIADQYNTVLKMSNKRSLTAAVLNVLAASDIFTQDIEDMPQYGNQEKVVDAEEVKPKKAKKEAPPVDPNLAVLHGASREAELEALCKQAGISPKFYLNRAGVDSASKMSEEDYSACLDAVRRKIKLAQEKAELGTV